MPGRLRVAGARGPATVGISAENSPCPTFGREKSPLFSSRSADLAVGRGLASCRIAVFVKCSRDIRTKAGKLMMKIQMCQTDGEVILQVEGRLAGAFVPELESCWQAARANHPDRKISVDLKNVTCVDRGGRYLLQLMHRTGVPFLRAGLATRDILEQIMEQPECNH